MTAVLVCVLLCAGCGRGPTPQQVVSGFYNTYATSRVRGLPSPAQSASLAPFLTPGLLAQIDSARKAQEAYSAKFPEDKPPFIEGDLFTSNFEGFSGFAVDTVRAIENGRFRIRVNLWYIDPMDTSNVVRWYDRVDVAQLEGMYKIDDFEFCAPWPFAQHGMLSELLRGTP